MFEALVKGLALGSVLAISVGPVIFTILKQSINNGKEGGLSFVGGVWLSDVLLIVLCNAFSEMVQHLLYYQQAIGYTGSIFLVGMGVFYAFFKKIKLRSDPATLKAFNKSDFAKIFSSGFLLNTLNPGVFLFWLTSATTLSVSHSVQERMLIFAACMGLNMGADILKVFLAGKIRHRLNLATISLINKISGSLLIIFGLLLFWGTYYALTKN
ncbi:LysE family translocator [Parasegetibacter sp. NRK P23]|uniref:LysE family translocator n=1 Tax=Parasegetibacter sp. NRK P23 TaxID=2942999 RepID=UPI002042CBD1|nr:LysE family transporter [Parasegetibacter sp. NRK P23]MCM5529727.1 LysE family transporter [Parasegetibacter sp. NRK P23]